MSKILFITDRFWPNPTAITFCLDSVIEMANLLGNECYVFTTLDESSQMMLEEHHESRIIREKCFAYTADTFTKHLIDKGGIRRLLGMSLNKLLTMMFSKYPENYRYSFNNKRNVSRLKEYIEKYKIDIVVSVSSPFSAHTLAYDTLKKTTHLKNIRWVVYEFDPYTFNLYLDHNTIDERMNLEYQIISASDITIELFGIHEYNVLKGFKNINAIQNKIYSVSFPNMVVNEKNNYLNPELSIHDNEIRMVHTGNIYTLDYIEYIKKLAAGSKYRFAIDFVGKGSKSISATEEKLVCTGHGFVSEEEKETMIRNCHVLLLCGDPMPNQFPSKIAFYLATGKPILHLAQSDDDACLNLLGAYQNYYSIHVNALNIDFEKLDEFLSDSPQKVMTPTEVRENMDEYLSDSVAHQIVDLIRGDT